MLWFCISLCKMRMLLYLYARRNIINKKQCSQKPRNFSLLHSIWHDLTVKCQFQIEVFLLQIQLPKKTQYSTSEDTEKDIPRKNPRPSKKANLLHFKNHLNFCGHINHILYQMVFEKKILKNCSINYKVKNWTLPPHCGPILPLRMMICKNLNLHLSKRNDSMLRYRQHICETCFHHSPRNIWFTVVGELDKQHAVHRDYELFSCFP